MPTPDFNNLSENDSILFAKSFTTCLGFQQNLIAGSNWYVRSTTPQNTLNNKASCLNDLSQQNSQRQDNSCETHVPGRERSRTSCLKSQSCGVTLVLLVMGTDTKREGEHSPQLDFVYGIQQNTVQRAEVGPLPNLCEIPSSIPSFAK